MNARGDTVKREYLQEVVERDEHVDAEAEVRRLFTKLSRIRAPQAGDTLLDIGCGTGAVIAALGRHRIHATGIDVVPELVHVGQMLHPSTVIQVGEAENLPFPSETFTFVMLASVLEHVRDWRLTLAEAARVLAPGGVLYLHTSNRLWPLQGEIRHFPGFGYLPGWLQRRIYGLVMKYWPRLIGYTHLPAYNWLTWWQVAGTLRRLGLEPHSWIMMMRPEDIPPRYRRFGWVLNVIRGSPVPLYPFVPNANVVLARKLSRRKRSLRHS